MHVVRHLGNDDDIDFAATIEDIQSHRDNANASYNDNDNTNANANTNAEEPVIEHIESVEDLASHVVTAFHKTSRGKVETYNEDDKVHEIRGADLPARKSVNWLKDYMRLSVGQESPDIFHFWGGVSAIGAALRRNVFLDFDYYKLHPNLYIMLIATSAKCKKSTAVIWAQDFVSSISSVHIAKDKMTPEGLLQRMSANICTVDADAIKDPSYLDDLKDPSKSDKILRKDGSIYIVAEEMKTLFSNISYVSGLIEILTSLYGCPASFPYTTRHTPIEIHNACVNLIGASTPEWLATGMPDHTRSGGFLGRFIFVVAHQPKRKIAWPEMDQAHVPIRSNLIYDLRNISRLRGRFHVTDEAKQFFDDWYQEFDIPEDPRLQEYYARKHDTIRKLAMIFSVAQSNELVIETSHMQEAMTALEKTEEDMLDAFMFLGSTTESVLGRHILQTLLNHGSMTRAKLISTYSYRLRRVRDMDDALSMLMQEERIAKEYLNTGNPDDKDSEGNPKIAYRVTTEHERRAAAEKRRRAKTISKVLFESSVEDALHRTENHAEKK